MKMKVSKELFFVEAFMKFAEMLHENNASVKVAGNSNLRYETF